MANKATYIGDVQNVDGITVSVSLSSDCISGLTYVNGEGYKIGQVGSFVKIPLGYNDLFGIVSQIGANAVPEKQLEVQPYGNRWMTIQLIGEGQHNGNFERGISQYPTIGDEVHLVSENDLKYIYGHIEKPYFVKVGHIAGAESIPALIDINKLVTRHSAIVGTTGSGKSTTVAGILNALSDPQKYPSSRIIVLDIHGEYANALSERANVYKINADKTGKKNENELYLPFWALSFDELVEISFGAISGEREKVIVLERILKSKEDTFTKYPKDGIDKETLSVDSPIPFSLNKLWYELYTETVGTYYSNSKTHPGKPIDNLAYEKDATEKEIKGNAAKGIPPQFRKPKNEKEDDEKINYLPDSSNIRNQLISLGAKIRIPRFDFLFNPGKWAPELDGKTDKDLDDLFKEWIGSEKPITIFDLSGVPSSILNTIIGVLLRILYEALFWTRNLSQGGRQRPLLLVMEEAHNYLNDNFNNSASIVVQRIVKEGRKYGIGAMIVSQRPSEINPTILSQCGTFISLRLSNATDRGHICSAVTDNLEGLTSMLPILRTGEAIILGEGVKLPMRALIDAPPKKRRPDSQDPIIYEIYDKEQSKEVGGWGIPMESNSNYKEFLQVWRSQNPNYNTKNLETMKRQAVSSSNIASIGYDETTSTLEIEFNHGGIYQYFDVPIREYQGLINADSKGKYFDSNIKKGGYRYSKV